MMRWSPQSSFLLIGTVILGIVHQVLPLGSRGPPLDFPLPLAVGTDSGLDSRVGLTTLHRPNQGAQAPSCEEAKIKCAYRTGCGRALQNYMFGCSSLVHGEESFCPEFCQHALIALTSTDEGKDLMTCSCADDQCEETKQRIEVCRPSVIGATNNESAVSCRVAQWICSADIQCSTALDYYHSYCKSMFKGKKCTRRCKNSISILRRQKNAAKLDNCWCDGREDYDCPTIRSNMARLCFPQDVRKIPEPPPSPPGVDSNELLPVSGSAAISFQSVTFFCILILLLISPPS